MRAPENMQKVQLMATATPAKATNIWPMTVISFLM